MDLHDKKSTSLRTDKQKSFRNWLDWECPHSGPLCDVFDVDRHSALCKSFKRSVKIYQKRIANNNRPPYCTWEIVKVGQSCANPIYQHLAFASFARVQRHTSFHSSRLVLMCIFRLISNGLIKAFFHFDTSWLRSRHKPIHTVHFFSSLLILPMYLQNSQRHNFDRSIDSRYERNEANENATNRNNWHWCHWLIGDWWY